MGVPPKGEKGNYVYAGRFSCLRRTDLRWAILRHCFDISILLLRMGWYVRVECGANRVTSNDFYFTPIEHLYGVWGRSGTFLVRLVKCGHWYGPGVAARATFFFAGAKSARRTLILLGGYPILLRRRRLVAA